MVPMTRSEVRKALAGVAHSSGPHELDGDMIHIWYKSFGKHSAKSIAEAARADELGLPKDRYTGRLVKVWQDGKGDLLIQMHVELERPGVYRTFNVNKGEFYKIAVLGRTPALAGAAG
jgi:hypothetical protein